MIPITQNDKEDLIFKAICDKSRRRILELLKNGEELSAAQIAANFSSAQSTISRHQSVLTKAGLIVQRKEGNTIYYSLNPETFVRISEWLRKIEVLVYQEHTQKTMTINIEETLKSDSFLNPLNIQINKKFRSK